MKALKIVFGLCMGTAAISLLKVVTIDLWNAILWPFIGNRMIVNETLGVCFHGEIYGPLEWIGIAVLAAIGGGLLTFSIKLIRKQFSRKRA